MREAVKQYGETVIEAVAAILVIGGFAGMVFGGGFARAAQLFSAWLYG